MVIVRHGQHKKATQKKTKQNKINLRNQDKRFLMTNIIIYIIS